MTPTPASWNELGLSENPAIELLQHLGYEYAAPETLEAERDSLKRTILSGRLATALTRLNPWLSPDNLAKAVKAVTTVPAASLAEAGETLHTTLTYGISLEQDRGGGKTSHSVRFFDFHDPATNDYLVTRQYKVSGSKKHICPDIVVFVNGIPLAVIECKSPTLGDKWRDEAITQLLRYQEAGDEFRGLGAPALFEPVQLVIGCCGQGAVYGTVGTPRRHWLEWKEPYPLTMTALSKELGRTPSPQDIALYSLLLPRNLLDLTRNFVAFETEQGRTIRKVCRYKQLIAVNKAMERIRTAPTPAERGGVVWHTQGSGKSLTMLWLALKLRRDPELENPTLLVVTDRRDLDRQISETFTRCGFPNPERARKVTHLRQLLSGPGGQVVMTTVQKFQDAIPAAKAPAKANTKTSTRRVVRPAHPTLSAASNIFVMVDEAHRTQYSSLAANMRAALPNACFLGFTGTPIDKKDRSTLTTFGPYIDTYTIEQAVADGAVVPIFYESRLPELRIIGQSLDKVFERVFADRSDEERAAIKKKYATEQTIAAAPKRIAAICLDIIEHYTSYIRPNKLKAQVVGVSREVAALYKETLDELNGPESAVIMSVGHNDGERLARYELSREQQATLIERFKDEDDELAILVVCDMLLTGFDAPVEQVMYLDSPLKEHTLLQAIARVNRTAEGKTYGLVVDYWGVSESLKEALAIFSPADVAGAMEPLHDELPRLQSRHQVALSFFAAVQDKLDLAECVAVLEPEDIRAEFKTAFRRLAQSVDMLLPRERALPYVDDVRWLGKIMKAARARYRDAGLDIVDMGDCGAKVRKLIEDAVVADGIEVLVRQVSLFSGDFDDKLEQLGTPEAKASEMEHAIRHEIHVKLEDNPAFYKSLRERLEEIVALRKQQRIDAARAIELLQAEVTRMRSLGDEARALGLSETGHAIYGLLRPGHGASKASEGRGAGYGGAGPDGDGDGDGDPAGDGEARELARQIESAVGSRTELVDWWQKDDVVRQLRRDIKRVLRGNVDDERLEALVAEAVDLIKRTRGGRR